MYESQSPERKSANYQRLLRLKPYDMVAGRIVNRARARSRKCDLPFELDMFWARERIIAGKCEATGIEFDLSRPGGPFVPSIDQREPGRGYTRENAQVVVWIYNAAKQDFAHQDVMKLAAALLPDSPAGARLRLGWPPLS